MSRKFIIKVSHFFQLVHIDLAPNFSASLMGITNFLANIISIIAPLVCGFIIQDEVKLMKNIPGNCLAKRSYL